MANTAAGYLTTLCENGTYVGGLMLTDRFGIPLDFQYTEPVIPSRVQKIIYGSVLDRYIRHHVIVPALLKDLTHQPPFFMVDLHQLAAMDQANSGRVFLNLQRTSFPPLGPVGTLNRAKTSETMLQCQSEEHPLRIVFGDVPLEIQEGVLKDLSLLTADMEITEPFTRLEAALKAICLDKSAL
jgi:hypothetical protein